VLRIGSPGLELWTHFDVMANALLQLVGTKRVLLFPPEQEPNLYVTVGPRLTGSWHASCCVVKYPVKLICRLLESFLWTGRGFASAGFRWAI
jgi:hypothetical protein